MAEGQAAASPETVTHTRWRCVPSPVSYAVCEHSGTVVRACVWAELGREREKEESSRTCTVTTTATWHKSNRHQLSMSSFSLRLLLTVVAANGARALVSPVGGVGALGGHTMTTHRLAARPRALTPSGTVAAASFSPFSGCARSPAPLMKGKKPKSAKGGGKGGGTGRKAQGQTEKAAVKERRMDEATKQFMFTILGLSKVRAYALPSALSRAPQPCS